MRIELKLAEINSRGAAKRIVKLLIGDEITKSLARSTVRARSMPENLDSVVSFLLQAIDIFRARRRVLSYEKAISFLVLEFLTILLE